MIIFNIKYDNKNNFILKINKDYYIVDIQSSRTNYNQTAYDIQIKSVLIDEKNFILTHKSSDIKNFLNEFNKNAKYFNFVCNDTLILKVNKYTLLRKEKLLKIS